MKRALSLTAQITMIAALTMPLSACGNLSFTDIMGVLSTLFGGGGQTTVVVCPRYPATPPEVVATLEREARADSAFGEWVIDQSQLKDNLEDCK